MLGILSAKPQSRRKVPGIKTQAWKAVNPGRQRYSRTGNRREQSLGVML
jgi:hypothetical protein